MHDELRQLDRVFLRDVVENPNDDTALLIYADWLMDQPDPHTQARGEHLRLSWLMERTADRRQRRDLHWRTQTLWWNHVERWLGRLYPAVDHFIYDRGRLCVEVSQEMFCRTSPDEFTDCPAWDWVTDVVVRKGSLDLLLHLSETPRPPLLASVDIGRRVLEGGELEYLLEEGFWKGVPELDLRRNALVPADIVALADWPGMEGVRVLDLEECSIGIDGAQALIRSSYVGAIEKLTVTMAYLDHDNSVALHERFGRHLRWA